MIYYDSAKEIYFFRISRYELEEAFRTPEQFREFIKKTFGYDLKYLDGEEVEQEHDPHNPDNGM